VVQRGRRHLSRAIGSALFELPVDALAENPWGSEMTPGSAPGDL